MKRATITIQVTPRRGQPSEPVEVDSYVVQGHLHVCRHPGKGRYWSIVHAPSGLEVDQGSVGVMPFTTRRKAVAVARDLVGKIPEIATTQDIQAFAVEREAEVRAALSWACNMHVLE